MDNGDQSISEMDGRTRDIYGIRAWREAQGYDQRTLAGMVSMILGRHINYQKIQRLEGPITPTLGNEPISDALQPILDMMSGSISAETVKGDVNLVPPQAIPKRDFRMDVPVYDLRANALGGVEMAGLITTITRHENIKYIKEAYGVQIRERNMVPVYWPGDVLIVNPALAPRVEKGVLIMSGDQHDIRIGEFAAEDDEFWTIKRYGTTPETIRLAKAQYPICHRVCATYPGV